MNCTLEMRAKAGEDHFTVRAGAWSPDGDTFAVGSFTGYVCIWSRGSTGAWAEPAVLDWRLPEDDSRRRGGAIRVMVFDRAGDQLATGDDKGAVHVWRRKNLTGGWERFSSVDLERGNLRGLDFSWDGQWLAGSTDRGIVCTWDPTEPNSSKTVLEGHEGAVLAGACKDPPFPIAGAVH
jgi:WD40 repeat protein